MLFIRHGPPNRRSQPDITQESNPAEIWYYDDVYFTFERIKGAGDFLFIPDGTDRVGNMGKAMESESFSDPLPALEQYFYGTDFKGPDGKLEIEFYQSLPVKDAPLETLEATVAVYDTTWMELIRDNTESKKVFNGEDSLWIAVNSVTLDSGPIYCALRMDVPGHRAVKRQGINPQPYSRGRLDLSGIILGSPSIKGQQVHQRRGVDILPRPSLTFRYGENITVYLEVYNLRKDELGARSYSEKVTVSLLEEKADESIIRRLFRRKKPRRSLTLSFDRYPSEGSGPVAEHFNIDTSNLVPGSYHLTIEVRDKNSRHRGIVLSNFELEPEEEQ